jgi:hypothetical protein
MNTYLSLTKNIYWLKFKPIFITIINNFKLPVKKQTEILDFVRNIGETD